MLSGLTLIVGLGQTGLSAVRVLTRLGAEVAVADSREQPPGLGQLRQGWPSLKTWLGPFRDQAFAGAARLVVSPGVALSTPQVAAARSRGVPVWGDIELFARLADPAVPVAAVTGSNGKSTVTTLLGRIAAAAQVKTAVGGNLGPPALDLLPAPGVAAPQLYVLELSSFQLEATASLRPAAATVLNLSPDHLDRYRTMDEYAAAKQRVLRHCRHAVLNADDPWVAAMATAGDADGGSYSLFSIAETGSNDLSDNRFRLLQHAGQPWLGRGAEPWLAVAELSPALAGKHNWANALAALGLGSALRLPRSAMLDGLRRFQGLPHRCELVAERRQVRWVNDSKATNVGATLAALHGLPGPLLLIAGGEGKNQDFAPLGAALAAHESALRALLVLGRDGAEIAAVAPPGLRCERAVDLDDAVARAARLARPGDSVLLSPACASFDMFDNYEHRGRVFAAAVRRLG